MTEPCPNCGGKHGARSNVKFYGGVVAGQGKAPANPPPRQRREANPFAHRCAAMTLTDIGGNVIGVKTDTYQVVFADVERLKAENERLKGMLREARDIFEGASIYLGHREDLSKRITEALGDGDG